MIEPANRLATIQEYYFSHKLKQINELKVSGKNILNLGIGNPDLPPPAQSINTLNSTSLNKNNHGYQSYAGNPGLRQGFSNWYKKHYGLNFNADKEMLPLIGSKEGIMHISMTFLNPNDEVLIPDPAYPAYRSVASLLGAKVKIYNLKAKNNWLPDFNELNKLDLNKVKLMWINYPNMPTGAKTSIKNLNKLIEFGAKNNILICNDNPYSFILNNKPLSIFNADGALSNALELNSLSKSHNMAGWRIGVVVGNESYISNILKVKSNMDSGMFLPLQLAAIEALNSPLSWYKNLNIEYKQRRKIAADLSVKLNCSFDKTQSGMFLWAKIPESFNNSFEFSDFLLNTYDLFITPGQIFGENGLKYIRISLAGDPKNLSESIKRVKDVIKTIQ